MESNAIDDSAGKTCADLAASGSVGNGSVAVCVDLMMLPFGNCTFIGDVVVCLLVHGVVSSMKLCVAPVSAMSVAICGGGRPIRFT